MEKFTNKKPEISYPCNWSYKIIGSSVDDMIIAVEAIVVGLEYEITLSNISRTEKYYSLNLKVSVPSENMRDLIFQKLDAHSAIKFVL